MSRGTFHFFFFQLFFLHSGRASLWRVSDQQGLHRLFITLVLTFFYIYFYCTHFSIPYRPKAKNPRGRRPRGFLSFGLAEDVAKGSPLENSEGGLQYSSEGVH